MSATGDEARLLELCSGPPEALLALSASERSVLARARSQKGASGLHLACFEGQLETAKRLREWIDVEVRDGGGGTPLHAACFAGHLPVVKWLEAEGAGIDSLDNRHARPIHHACLAGRSDVVRWLLWHGADAVEPTLDGAAPADVARDAGHELCAKIVTHHLEKPAKRRRIALAPPQLPPPQPLLPPRLPPVPPKPEPPPMPAPRSAPMQQQQQRHTPICATPAQLFQSYVPVSAKAQCDTAREHMAGQAMLKMGRRGVQRRVPTWLQKSTTPP